jgi:hypothetical protein
MATEREPIMAATMTERVAQDVFVRSSRRGNGLRGTALLLLIAVVAATLFFAPALRTAPRVEPSVDTPAMTHVPPPGGLQIEAQ